MAVTPTQIVTKKSMVNAGYLVVTQNATTRVLAVLDGVVYPTQSAAQAALDADAASAVSTTIYLILRVHPMAGILATVT